ncbi:MAG: hypothetical protein H6706_20440 [Myxococcales bacterium]|nr:hypothetical protein [Myxococcales bacterium]
MTSPPSRRPPSSGSRRIDKLLICLAFLLGAAHAEPAPVEVRVEDGVVDWSTREVRVLGVGTPTILSHTGSVTPQDPYLLARADAEERLRRVLVALPVDGRRAMDVEALAPLFETALQHWRADAPLYFSDGTLHLQGRASFAWGAALAGPPVPQAADAPTGLVIRLKQPMEPRLRLVLTGEAAPATPAGLPGDRIGGAGVVWVRDGAAPAAVAMVGPRPVVAQARLGDRAGELTLDAVGAAALRLPAGLQGGVAVVLP